METQALRVLPLLVVFGVACSDATGDTGGLQTLGGYTSVAGTGGQAFGGSAPGGAGASGSAGSTSSVAGQTFGGSAGAGAGTGGTLGGTAGGSAAGAGGQGGGAPLDGKGLYDANCKMCHADQGLGSPLAPEIMHPVRDYATWVVRNGRAQTTYLKPMDKWGTDKLSDAQLMLIFDYLDQPPQPTTGQGLFNDYCANCHGANGKGGPTMRDITNEVAKVLAEVRSGKNVGNYSMRHDSMPAFSTSRISDSELMLIRDYVDSL